MAGLFAAKALAEHYRQVTIIERDRLDTSTAARRGVPQGSHIHGFLLRGAEILEELCPGFCDEVTAHGGTQIAYPADILVDYLGQPLCSPPAEHRIALATRPFLEMHLRRRVLDTPGIVMRDGWEVTGVLSSAHGDRVAGVRIAQPGLAASEETVEADLVVEALGRAGRGKAWLSTLGYPSPAEQRVHVGVRYASRHYRLQPHAADALPARIVAAFPHRDRRRGMFLSAQEGQTWVVSLTGYDGFTPPTDPDEFLDLIRELASQEVYTLVRDAEPMDDTAVYRFPAGHRRRYDGLRRHPHGLISTGDSICCLNPLYGTGITIAAELALLLRDCLRLPDRSDLPRRFYKGAARITRAPWLMTKLADRSVNPPDRPSPTTALTSAYMRRVAYAASQDPAVATAFYESLGMIASPWNLAHPRMLARVLLRPRAPHDSTARARSTARAEGRPPQPRRGGYDA